MPAVSMQAPHSFERLEVRSNESVVYSILYIIGAIVVIIVVLRVLGLI
jgi:hypothetical protein